ncbi:S41 family peptidase [Spongiimicrobium sp. 3-5]|uniref:S41 family peptidase n=1 Tax=Spongiimicrobium sp. 3-5 TaxID=3332596 RepID=UPI00397F84A5
MRTKRTYFLLITVTVLLTACKSEPKNEPTIAGIWQSLGYGKILTIEEDSYAFYDRTKISCLPVQQGKIATFGDGLTLLGDTLILAKGTGLYHYKRIPALPPLCSQPLSEEKRKDPIYNFEVMAQTITAHFAYFKRNNINWDSLYTVSKAKITSTTTEAELYLVLEEIGNTLKDNHGYIEPTDKVYEQAEALRPAPVADETTEELEEYGDFPLAKMVAKTFLDEDLTRDTWLMHWGKMKNNVGYLQVKAMWLYADLNLSDSSIQKHGFVDTYVKAYTALNETDYIAREAVGAQQIMDKVMKDLRTCSHIIVDVRFNGGGQDAVSLEILRRFNDQRKQVATKRAVMAAGFTQSIPIFLEASANPYTKPVYLLTSQQSASATDFMALASLELPNIKRIGSHTNGALSDALEKKLPNGWYFSVSNEVYLDNQGTCYENNGIPVDYELNYPEDRQPFFRTVAHDLEKDKADILDAIEKVAGKTK